MKRIAALLLAGLLCVSMTACGETGKYDELIGMLEDGDYSAAIGYIQDLQGNNMGNLILGGEVVEDKPTELTEEQQTLLKSLYGDWVCAKETEGHPKSVTFHANETCAIDGKEMTWKRSTRTFMYGKLTLDILDAGKEVYTADVRRSDNGELAFFLYKHEYKSDSLSSITLSSPAYISATAYEAVTITMDNWQEYFQWTEETSHGTNGFGELSSMSTYYRLSLKQEYFDRLSDYETHTGTAEISYTSRTYQVTVDRQNNTYTMGVLKDDFGIYGETSNVINMQKNGNYCGFNYSDCMIHSLDNPSETFCYHPDNPTLKRIQGTLYLLKNS